MVKLERLAIVCTIKGYPFIAVMSRGNSSERAQMMRAFGAEVILVDQAQGSPPGTVTGLDLELVEEETQKITRKRRAFRVDQFNNLSNVFAHEYHTGEEIWEQTQGQLDVFLDFSGSAGTFMGVAREEAIFAGYSSGANLAAALKLLKKRERGKRIVILIVDSGLKYLSTDLYEF